MELIQYHRKQHEAYQHNVSPRLEGVVKNIGIKPVHKAKSKKKVLSKKLEKEAERYAQEQFKAPEPLM
ncbi:MAG: hypothetical protein KGH79_04045 [Patescibacteria group bacterium]|nr:hypothetical protein [Patescibacteria group bacterium]